MLVGSEDIWARAVVRAERILSMEVRGLERLDLLRRRSCSFWRDSMAGWMRKMWMVGPLLQLFEAEETL